MGGNNGEPSRQDPAIAATRIGEALRKALGGATMAEVGIATAIGVRAPDVAWRSDAFPPSIPRKCPLHGAELCVEIVSATNAPPKLRERAMAYVNAGAVESWIVNPQSGEVEIYARAGRRAATGFAVDVAHPATLATVAAQGFLGEGSTHEQWGKSDWASPASGLVRRERTPRRRRIAGLRRGRRCAAQHGSARL
ncbi:MAG: Uma2 family endonuclease [Betaproteobacteria bacterium]